MKAYEPPLALSASLLRLVGEICERVGRLSVGGDSALTPQLRRGNRIRTIQASLAIENNTLSVEQVTAVLEGKRVLGLPREIQEVRNAFRAYEYLPSWHPTSQPDLLAAHASLMEGLIDDAGHFRQGGVGIYRGDQLLHMAPPANRVPTLVGQLLEWLGHTDWHPLLASCVFHYEFEFIHPFADGNGRMGRLWQTLILSRWNPLLAYLPVETVIHAQQEAYYAALAEADHVAQATPFVDYMLRALLAAMDEVAQTEQVSDQVTDQVNESVQQLLQAFNKGEALKSSEIMRRLGLSHRPTFRKNYLGPAMASGLLEMTQPDSPRSPQQCYRLTDPGWRRRVSD